MTPPAPLALSMLVAVALVASPALSSAQGQGQGQGQGRPKNPPRGGPPGNPAPPAAPAPAPPPSPSGGGEPAPAATAPISQAPSAPTEAGAAALAPQVDLGAPLTFRQFGAWLDDASTAYRGTGFLTLAAGHWRLPGITQTNIPMVAVGLGLTDRVQVGASVPFYRVNFQGGTAAGLDDVYLSGKINLIDPTLTVSEVGLAVSPAIEILNSGADRVHFAIPVSVELRRFPFRLFASGGYFSRGSIFSGGALEWTSRTGTTLTGALTQSYSLAGDVLLDELGIGRQRVDISGSMAHLVHRSTILSLSLGRSLSPLDEGGTGLAFTGGVTMRFSAAGLAP